VAEIGRITIQGHPRKKVSETYLEQLKKKKAECGESCLSSHLARSINRRSEIQDN
jgi:hypothetical protein